MVTNPEDTDLACRRDGEQVLAVQADARAADAERAGDHDTATTLRHQATEHHRSARALDEALRATQGGRAGAHPAPTPDRGGQRGNTVIGAWR